MKIKAKRLAIVLSLMIAVCSIMPLQAQTDGFFRGGNDNYENRSISINSDTENGLTNNGIGQSEPTPLGSGLLIMMAAGAGYVMVRRKRNRSGMTMLLALGLLVGMTQCKKNVGVITGDSSSGMHIILNVNDDSKVHVTLDFHNDETGEIYAKVDYELGDLIHVGNNGKYVGYLTCKKDKSDNLYFEGTINDDELNENDYLHFYFLGNKTLNSINTATGVIYTVDIVDQSEQYPVISYAHSTDKFNPYVSSYNAHLLNKCSIVKFTTNIDITDNISISGMNNMVIVDFTKNVEGGTANPYSYMLDENNNGEIILHSEGVREKWAILLPQDEVTAATANAQGYVSTTSFGVPAISTNQYKPEGIAISMKTVAQEKGISVSPTKQAVFANGNLKATKTNASDDWTSWTWSFMDNPWDAVETSTSEIVSDYEGSTEIGLFGCNPKDHPYYTNANENYDGRFTTWTSSEIANDDNNNNYTWYVPSQAEWAYILTGRDNAASKYGMAVVNGKPGLIILPDVWGGPSLVAFSDSQAYSDNTISESVWNESWKPQGAVFIPANGYRQVVSIAEYNIWGGYWTSTTGITGNGYYMRFVAAGVDPHQSSAEVDYMDFNNYLRFYAGSLRLMRYVE